MYFFASDAQDSLSTYHEGGTAYVQKFKDKITLKLGLNNSAEVFAVKTSGDSYILKPNPSQILRTYFSYRFISFFVSAAPRFLPGNNDDVIKGKSSGFALAFNFTMRKWFSELSFSTNRGYYLENTKDFFPTWKPGDPYFQAPDLRITSYEGITGYNTNGNHSLSAIWSQTERQLKSAGTFIPRVSYRYYITNDLSVGTTQKSNNFQVLLGAGYQHTFVAAKKIYFFAAVAPAVGYVFTKLVTRFPSGDIANYSHSPIGQLDMRSGIGYNNSRYFFGTYMTILAESFRQENATAVNTNGQLFFQVFAGIRLKASRAIEKTIPDW